MGWLGSKHTYHGLSAVGIKNAVALLSSHDSMRKKIVYKTSGKNFVGNVAFGIELVHASIHWSTSKNCRFIGWAEWAWMIHGGMVYHDL